MARGGTGRCERGSAFCGSATSLEVRYTDKPVSGWGGLVAVQRYLEKRGVAEVLVQALPDGRTSPNQIPVLDIAWTFLATVLTGKRFAHWSGCAATQWCGRSWA